MTDNNDGDDGDGNYETIPEIFLEGLTHDILILNKLLKRHRCSHGRTIYFRRMNMTLKCLLQTQRMIMVENVHRLKELQKNINQYHQQLNRKKKKQKRQPREEEEEEEWNLLQQKPTLTATNDKTSAKVNVSQLTVLIEEFQKLIYVWTQQIPEILSRIQHSSIALIKEISRGFFLPFCTVAIGSLARIRTIVMEIIGVHGLTILYNLQSELKDIILHQKQHQQGDNNNEHMTMMMMTDATYTKCMNMFVENNNNVNDTTNHQDNIVDRSAILRSLGLTESQSTTTKSRSGKQKHNNDTATTTTTDMGTLDHYTLSASASLSHPPIKLYHEDELDELYIDDDDDNNIDSGATTNDDNTVDRNMAMVDSYQKRRQKEQNNKSNVSNKKRKSTTTTAATATMKTSMNESSLSHKKKKKKDKKKKEKSKNKTDFFDQLFD